MGPFIGCDGFISIDGTSLAHIKSYRYSRIPSRVDARVMGQKFQANKHGQIAFTGEVRCLWDTIDDTAQAAIVSAIKSIANGSRPLTRSMRFFALVCTLSIVAATTSRTPPSPAKTANGRMIMS